MTQSIEVSLPGSTMYVAGRVNGTVVTWTNTGGNTWEAEAERASDGIYVLELSVTKENGTVSNLSTVVFYGDLSLVTDRSEEDVARWRELHQKGFSNMTAEEQSEWLGTMKGRYDHTDMNRVEAAVKYLSERFSEQGYIYVPVVKTDWSPADIPTRADMDRYFGNVDGLKTLIAVFPTTPPSPFAGDRLDYIMANDLEQILMDLDRAYLNMTQSRNYAGDINAGEV